MGPAVALLVGVGIGAVVCFLGWILAELDGPGVPPQKTAAHLREAMAAKRKYRALTMRLIEIVRAQREQAKLERNRLLLAAINAKNVVAAAESSMAACRDIVSESEKLTCLCRGVEQILTGPLESK